MSTDPTRAETPATAATRPSESTPGVNLLQGADNFSLILGGPLYQFFCRAHLSDPALHLLRRRIVVISMIAWFPLLVFSAWDGNLVGNDVTVPFLRDLETHIRFLVVVPLLLISELVVHLRLRFIARSFLDRNLIPEGELPRFDAIIRSAFRLRNSIVAEVLLLVIVYAVGVLIVWRRHTILDAATWYVTSSADGARLFPAGVWYGYVSLPIFQFLLLRWYYRLFIWTRFLWQVSRIPLQLVPTHPDRVGGLGMLSNAAFAFNTLLLAHGTMVAAQIANRILFLGAPLSDFKGEIGAVVFFLVSVVVGPLLLFAVQLARAKRRGLLEYGTFAEQYVRQFDSKWLRSNTPAGEPMLGSADIQSLADLANSFEVVRSMRIAPVTRDTFIQLAVAVLAPIVPLLLTTMPLEALVNKLLGLLF
jgi:hypothetical protein